MCGGTSRPLLVGMPGPATRHGHACDEACDNGMLSRAGWMRAVGWSGVDNLGLFYFLYYCLNISIFYILIFMFSFLRPRVPGERGGVESRWLLAGMPNPPVMAGLATKRGRLVPLLGIGPATWHRRSTGAGSDARRELWRACSVADATPPNDHTTVAEMSLTFGEVVSASQISGARYQTVTPRRVIIWP